MKSLDALLSKLTILMIRSFYQKFVSTVLDKKFNVICRFHPSCSNYSILAFQKYGFIKGFKKTISRIQRCKPDNYDNCFDLP